MKQYLDNEYGDLPIPKKTRIRKKLDKPWQLQYKWSDRKVYAARLYKSRDLFGTWIPQFEKSKGCYMDPFHMTQVVENELRTDNGVLNEFFYAGREWRLFHLETKETITVVINLQTKEVTINEHKRT
jgi:hypothetical protein